jgi:acyl-CoA dehydrogenase
MDIAYRALHLHGALGATNEMPFGSMFQSGIVLGLADGPTEVHKDNLARKLLKNYRPANDLLFSDAHIPTRAAAAREKFAAVLEHDIANS